MTVPRPHSATMAASRHFDLVANAQDSLTHAVRHIVGDNDPAKWKIAVREVTHVIELLLKERLRREHRALLWVNVEEVDNPEKNTVNLQQAQARLARICAVRLSPEANDALTLCKRLRNQIEHFEFRLNEKEAEAIVARLLSFIFSFAEHQLGFNWEREHQKDATWKKLIGIRDFAQEHVKAIQERLSKERIPTADCPACYWHAFNLSADRCELCGHLDSRATCAVCEETYWKSQGQIVSIDVAANRQFCCEGCIDSMYEPGEPEDNPEHEKY